MSGNLGQTVSPVVLSWTNDKFGWKTTFLLPGIVGIGVSALCYLAISDKPPADVVAKAGPESKKPKEENGKKTQAASAFRTKVLTNVNFWLIVVADVLIYFVLKALSDWSMKMLKEDRKFSLIVSSSCLTAYEAGGVLGTLLTGFVSDKLGSRRNLTSLIYVGILFPSLVCLWQLPPGTSPMVISTVLFFAGFGVYGPKTLCGLAVRETHSVAAGTAGGFLGAAGQVGAAAAGYPLGLIADNYGWEGVYSAMVLASFLAIFLFFSLSQNEKRKSNKKMD
jgi:MFS transporter, OPA family, sugar phosphate sensor protein UhpC